MRRRGLKSIEIEESFVNLTPLIDVVFVVLIMFILIAPMLDLDRISLADANNEKVKEEQLNLNDHNAIKIFVGEDNAILINGRSIDLENIKRELLFLKKNYPLEVPKLFQDEKASFGTYQKVKNAVEASGFEELDVVLKSR
ncbi:MAG: biopolymer transporter ExbD [Simkaniaceae bacterium]